MDKETIIKNVNEKIDKDLNSEVHNIFTEEEFKKAQYVSQIRRVYKKETNPDKAKEQVDAILKEAADNGIEIKDGYLDLQTGYKNTGEEEEIAKVNKMVDEYRKTPADKLLTTVKNNFVAYKSLKDEYDRLSLEAGKLKLAINAPNEGFFPQDDPEKAEAIAKYTEIAKRMDEIDESGLLQNYRLLRGVKEL